MSNGSSAAMNRIWEEFEEDCLSLAGRRGAEELTMALEAWNTVQMDTARRETLQWRWF